MSEPDAYAALHAAIVAGELSPGERLIEEELAEQLGQSRGAVRGAILRLGHEGLVVRERNRGARVRRFTPEEAVEVLEARAALESLAAGYAALRRTDDEAARAAGARRGDGAAAARRGSCWRCPSATPSCTGASSRSRGTSVARDIGARLHSQVVRFQFRTVLAPGPPAEVARRAPADRDGDRRRRPRRRPSRRCASTSATWPAVLADVAAPERAAL